MNISAVTSAMHQPIRIRNILVATIITVCAAALTFSVTIWKTSGHLVWSDGLAYFMYAKSIVLDADTDLTNEYREISSVYPPRALASLSANIQSTPDGSHVKVPWPPGDGLATAPFYALGYGLELLVANVSGRPADPYGIIPQIFFGIASIAYGLLGILATFWLCNRLATAGIAWMATLATFLGGPAIFYVFVDPSMAHAPSYGLVALLVLVWYRQWKEGITVTGMAFCGFLLGLLVTIRFQNVLFGTLAFPLLQQYIASVRGRNLLYLPLAGLAGFLAPLSLLLAASADIAGSGASTSWLPGGVITINRVPIDLKSPFFLDVLFSCRHGLFYWTPIAALGTLGLAVTTARKDAISVTFLLTILLQVYLIGGLGIVGSYDHGQPPATSWNDHWMGGTSFSMRYLTECTPLFGAGLAYLLSFRPALTRLLIPVLPVLVAWNLLLILAYGMNTISHSYCVTFTGMLNGIGEAVRTVFGLLT